MALRRLNCVRLHGKRSIYKYRVFLSRFIKFMYVFMQSIFSIIQTAISPFPSSPFVCTEGGKSVSSTVWLPDSPWAQTQSLPPICSHWQAVTRSYMHFASSIWRRRNSWQSCLARASMLRGEEEDCSHVFQLRFLFSYSVWRSFAMTSFCLKLR